MATKKILIQVILDDKASASNKKLGNSLGKTTGEFKKMTAEQEKQYVSQQKNVATSGICQAFFIFLGLRGNLWVFIRSKGALPLAAGLTPPSP